MKRRTDGLVRAYLERVSGRLLEAPHRALIAGLIRGHAGVYALYKSDRLYYVGLAKNLMSRVNHHLKDRHAKRWDKFSVYLTSESEHMKPLESLLLRIAQPTGNRVNGRVPGATDLLRVLGRAMTDADNNRRAMLLGNFFQRNRVRRKTAAASGSLVLAGLVDRRLHLRAEYKGVRYRASLLKNGHVSYLKRKYVSPSAAAKAIVGRAVNGWRFWKYQRPRKGWVELRELRA
jgi:hypothetical protein